MKGIKFFVLVILILSLVMFKYLNAMIYSTVSGKIVDEETGAGLNGTNIEIYNFRGSQEKTTSNEKGEFSISNIPPGIYGITFEPPEPYAWDKIDFINRDSTTGLPKGMQVFTVLKGKNVYILKKCKIGGVLELRTFEKGSNIPIQDISIYYITGVNLRLITNNHLTNSQGIYYLKQLAAGKLYILLKKDGLWRKEINDIEIQYNQTTRIDIPYDLEGLTKITGSLKCDQTGEPLKDIMVFIGSLDRNEGSQCRADENGIFSMLDMKPGRYELRVIGYAEMNGKKEKIIFTKTVLLAEDTPVNVNFVLDCNLQYRKKGY